MLAWKKSLRYILVTIYVELENFNVFIDAEDYAASEKLQKYSYIF
jgi:hypothetical protein